jgi:hypothetical protein
MLIVVITSIKECVGSTKTLWEMAVEGGGFLNDIKEAPKASLRFNEDSKHVYDDAARSAVTGVPK